MDLLPYALRSWDGSLWVCCAACMLSWPAGNVDDALTHAAAVHGAVIKAEVDR